MLTSTAAVQIVSTATLAALIGGGGLGEIVFNGIATIRNEIILAGVLPIAALALLVEGLFRLVSRVATPRGLRFHGNILAPGTGGVANHELK